MLVYIFRKLTNDERALEKKKNILLWAQEFIWPTSSSSEKAQNKINNFASHLDLLLQFTKQHTGIFYW